MRKFIVMDTETTNGLDQPLVYDFGFAVIDEEGFVYDKKSFIIYDIFFEEEELMKSAYYANKRKKYLKDIKDGKRKVIRWITLRNELEKAVKEWKVEALMAHNAYFDYNACLTTQRWLSKSKYRYFFPFNIELWDTLKMARQTFAKDESYINFCNQHEFLTNGKPQLKAETIYRYMLNNPYFEESHTGLEDVLIERHIFKGAIRRDRTIDRNLFKPKEPTPPPTEIQKRIMKMIKGY